MATATLTDVESRLGRPLVESEEQLATTLLDDVELLIRRRIPELSTLDEDILVMVESRAVARILRNPEGVRTQNADGFGYTLDSQVASGRLQLLDDEWYLLGVRRGYASIPTKFRKAAPDAPFAW